MRRIDLLDIILQMVAMNHEIEIKKYVRSDEPVVELICQKIPKGSSLWTIRIIPQNTEKGNIF